MQRSSTTLRWWWPDGRLERLDRRIPAGWVGEAGSQWYGLQVGSDGFEVKQELEAVLRSRQRRTVSDPSLTCAAVLVPLLVRDGEWCVLVTRRTQHVGHHKGQMSFPGGACDAADAHLEATALRETYEEIGIPPEAVEVLGLLDDLPTITDFVITPFVGVIPYPFPYRLN